MNIDQEPVKASKVISFLQKAKHRWFAGIMAVDIVKTYDYKFTILLIILSKLQLIISILTEEDSKIPNSFKQGLALFYVIPVDILTLESQLIIIACYWIFIFFLIFKHLQKNCQRIWLKVFSELISLHIYLFYYYINNIMCIIIFQQDRYIKIALKNNKALQDCTYFLCFFIIFLNIALTIIIDRFYFQQVNYAPVCRYKSNEKLMIMLIKMIYSFCRSIRINHWILYAMTTIICILILMLEIHRTIYSDFRILKAKLLMLSIASLISLQSLGVQLSLNYNWLMLCIIIPLLAKAIFLYIDKKYLLLYLKRITELKNTYDCIGQFYAIQATLNKCLSLGTLYSDRYKEEIYFKGSLNAYHTIDNLDYIEKISNPQKHVAWLLQEYIHKFPKCFFLKTLALNYFIQIGEANGKATLLLGDIQSISSLNIYEELELFKMKTLLNKDLFFIQSVDIQEIKQWIAYRESIAKFMNDIILQVKNIQKFWAIFQKNHISLRDLNFQSIQISNFQDYIAKEWKDLCKFKYKKPALIYGIYGMYNHIGLNSNKNARELFHLYKSCCKQSILDEIDINTDKEVFFSLDGLHMIISAQKNNIGKILACSDNVHRILGYTQEDLINHDIQKIIPSIYTKEHHHYMKRFMEIGEFNVIHEKLTLFYINNKNHNANCGIKIIIDNNIKYGICFIALLTKRFHNGWHILLDHKGNIDSFSEKSIYNDNTLPLNINQICPDFIKIQEAFNYMFENYFLIKNKNDQITKDNLDPKHLQLYDKYTNGHIINLKKFKDNTELSEDSPKHYEQFLCIVQDSYIKQVKNEFPKIIRIMHLLSRSEGEKEYLSLKTSLSFKESSIEDLQNSEYKDIDYMNNSKDSRIHIAQVPFTSPIHYKLTEINSKTKQTHDGTLIQFQKIYSTSTEKNSWAQKIIAIHKKISNSVSKYNTEKFQKTLKLINNSKKVLGTSKDERNAKDIKYKSISMDSISHCAGIINIDQKSQLNSINPKKKPNFQRNKNIQNPIMYTPSTHSSITFNNSKIIRDIISKDYNSRTINLLKYFLCGFILIQITSAMISYLIESNVIDQMSLDINAIRYNTQRFDNVVEINRRVRSLCMLKEGFMTETRHAWVNLPVYTTKLKEVLYSTSINLKEVSNCLRNYSGLYLADLNYKSLIDSIQVDWNSAELGTISQKLNIFDATSLIVSETLKIANSSANQDLNNEIEFILSNTLGEFAIQLHTDSLAFETEVLNAIYQISSSQYTIAYISISIIILAIICIIFVQCKLRYKKEEVLLLFTKLRDFEIKILIKRIELLDDFLNLDNMNNHDIEKVIYELKLLENKLDRGIDTKRNNFNKTIRKSRIHKNAMKQSFKMIFIFLAMIIFYVTQSILFNNFTQLCTNYSNMISKFFTALKNQGLAFAMIYQYIQTNGTTYVMNQNITQVIDQKLKAMALNIDFIILYGIDDNLVNEMNFILQGDLCAKNALSYTCYMIGNSAGQHGLIGLNAWMATALSDVYTQYLTSNRSKETAISAINHVGLIQLEVGYSQVIRPAYTALSELLIIFFQENSEIMTSILFGMIIVFIIVLFIIFFAIILPIISEMNKDDLYTRKILTLVPDALYFKNTNFRTYLIKELRWNGNIKYF